MPAITETKKNESKYPVPALRVVFINMTNKGKLFALAEKKGKGNPEAIKNLVQQKLPLFYEHKIKAKKYDLL